MEFNLRKYWRLVVKWWWLLIIGAVVPVGIAYPLLARQPPLYQARVILMVGNALQSANPNTTEIGIAGRLARGYAELVRHRPVTEKVVRRLGLKCTPEQLAAQISTLVRSDANLLEIRVADQNPRAAAMIANALAEELIRQTPAAQAQGEQQRFVEQQLEKLRAKIEQVEQEIESQTAQLVNLTSATEIQAAQENLNSLETVLSRYRSEYALYLQSYVGESVNKLTVIEPATVPQYPMGSRKILFLGLAGIVGLGLAMAGAVLIEYLDNTIEWNDEQDDSLPWHVLGTLSRMADDLESLCARPRALAKEAELLRDLRTVLLIHRERQPFDTLLITGPAGGEGKSFVAANLGAALADAGLRVILVDANLRHPGLHECLEQPNVFGLADLLEGEGDSNVKGLQSTKVDNLWLLPAGTSPLDPTLTLMSGGMGRLMREMCRRADIVIVEGPPVSEGHALTVLASRLDRVLIVVAQGITTYEQIAKAERYLKAEGVTVLGAVVNLVRGHSSWLTAVRRLLAGTFTRPRASMTTGDGVLLSVADAASIMGVSTTTVRRWIAKGRISAIRDGWRWRIKRQELLSLIADDALAAADLPLRGDGRGRSELVRQEAREKR